MLSVKKSHQHSIPYKKRPLTFEEKIAEVEEVMSAYDIRVLSDSGVIRKPQLTYHFKTYLKSNIIKYEYYLIAAGYEYITLAILFNEAPDTLVVPTTSTEENSTVDKKYTFIERIYLWLQNKNVYKVAKVCTALSAGALLSSLVFSGIFGYGAAPGFIALNITGLAFVSVYFAAHRFVNVVVPRMKNELQADLDKIDIMLKQRKFRLLYDFDPYLKSKYALILRDSFPFNDYLKWYFYILQGRFTSNPTTHEHSDCRRYGDVASFKNAIKALQYARTDEQVFVTVKNIINSQYYFCVERKEEYALHYCLLGQIDGFSQAYEKEIAPYRKLIPTTCKSYIDLYNNLAQEIDECRRLFAAGDTSERLFKKFNAIEFDGFCQEAYPDLAALFYQLDATMIMLGKRPYGKDAYDDMWQTLRDAHDSLQKAHCFLGLVDPQQAKIYGGCVLDFSNNLDTMRARDKEYEPMLFSKQDSAQATVSQNASQKKQADTIKTTKTYGYYTGFMGISNV